MATTITEALAEIKTIKARIDKRRGGYMQYVVRDARAKDPLEMEGGSVEFVRRERQAIGDLQQRVVDIRTAIQRANLETTLTVQGVTKTVAEWLNWRREVSAEQKNELAALTKGMTDARRLVQQRGGKVAESDAQAGASDVVVMVSERDLAAATDHIELVLGELDGKLSLMNATTLIDL